mgnify:FL=1
MAGILGTLTAPGAQFLGNTVLGGIGAFLANKNKPDSTTTGEMMGVKPPKPRTTFSESFRNNQATGAVSGNARRLDTRLPGVDTFAEESPFGAVFADQGPMDPNAITDAMISDAGKLFEAAEIERDRALSAGADVKGQLQSVEAEATDQLAKFDSFRETLGTGFRDAKKALNASFDYAKALPLQITQAVKAGTAQVMALYGSTRQLAGDALNKAGLEVARFIDATREGIDRQTETHKAQLSAELAGQGWDADSINVAMRGIDYEKGSVLLSQTAAIAEQQTQRLQDMTRDLVGVVGSAGAAAGAQVAGLQEMGANAKVEASKNMTATADAMTRLSEVEGTVQGNLLATQASYRSQVQALRVQGYGQLAEFMAGIEEPVLAVSPIILANMSLWQTIAAEDNQAQLESFQNTLAAFGMFQQGVQSGYGSYNQAMSVQPPPKPKWYESVAGPIAGGIAGGASQSAFGKRGIFDLTRGGGGGGVTDPKFGG